MSAPTKQNVTATGSTNVITALLDYVLSEQMVGAPPPSHGGKRQPRSILKPLRRFYEPLNNLLNTSSIGIAAELDVTMSRPAVDLTHNHIVPVISDGRVGNPNRDRLLARIQAVLGEGQITDDIDVTLAALLESRLDRWRHLVGAVHGSVPETFTVWRYFQDKSPSRQFLREIVSTWDQGQSINIPFPQYEIVPWSLEPAGAETNIGANRLPGALLKATVPFDATILDVIADDSSFLTIWDDQAEVITYNPARNFVSDEVIIVMPDAGKNVKFSATSPRSELRDLRRRLNMP